MCYFLLFTFNFLLFTFNFPLFTFHFQLSTYYTACRCFFEISSAETLITSVMRNRMQPSRNSDW